MCYFQETKIQNQLSRADRYAFDSSYALQVRIQCVRCIATIFVCLWTLILEYGV